MKLCVQCQTEISDDAKFCTKCGAKQEPVVATVEKTEAEAEQFVAETHEGVVETETVPETSENVEPSVAPEQSQIPADTTPTIEQVAASVSKVTTNVANKVSQVAQSEEVADFKQAAKAYSDYFKKLLKKPGQEVEGAPAHYMWWNLGLYLFSGVILFWSLLKGGMDTGVDLMNFGTNMLSEFERSFNGYSSYGQGYSISRPDTTWTTLPQAVKSVFGAAFALVLVVTVILAVENMLLHRKTSFKNVLKRYSLYLAFVTAGNIIVGSLNLMGIFPALLVLVWLVIQGIALAVLPTVVLAEHPDKTYRRSFFYVVIVMYLMMAFVGVVSMGVFTAMLFV
ncbi:MAG: zinc-ribbon domain-containing protein [Aerococcaceae bacterium]|nr:zinc-ribbon domain-containing protein [Aerococcaceae bacterium]